MHCCKSRSHYMGDECCENMGTENSPCLSTDCFLLQHTMHCTCSIFSLPSPSEPQVLQVISQSSPLMRSFQIRYLPQASFILFPFSLLAEDHHSLTHRTRTVLAFLPSTCSCLHWAVAWQWKASIKEGIDLWNKGSAWICGNYSAKDEEPT